MTDVLNLPKLNFPEIDGLNIKNQHERDKRIKFYDEGHIYDVDGRRDFVSCTTFVHQFYKEFDPDFIIDRMMRNKEKFNRGPYSGMTKEEIKKKWSDKGTLASRLGTILHASIEFFYNDCLTSFPYQIPPEFDSQFKKFQEEIVIKKGYQPFRTEWFIFDEEHELAGSVDMTYKLKDSDELVIYDWKRSCKLSQKTNNFQTMLSPLDHLPDTSFWHYVTQLNIYRHILETKYGKTIVGMFLVGIHPDLPDYQLEEVPEMREDTEKLFKIRKDSIKK